MEDFDNLAHERHYWHDRALGAEAEVERKETELVQLRESLAQASEDALRLRERAIHAEQQAWELRYGIRGALETELPPAARRELESALARTSIPTDETL